MQIRTILLLVLFPTLANAQFGRPILDSLLKVLPTLKEDTNKVNALARVSANYSRIDAGKGITAGQEGVALARRLNWLPGVSYTMNSLGLCYIADAEYAKALACLDTSCTINEKIGNRAGLLVNYMNEATLVVRQGYFSRGVDWTMRSIKIAEQIHDSSHIAQNLYNMASIYSQMSDYPRSLEYDQQAYAYYKRSKDKNMLALVLGSLADGYDGIGQRAKSLDAYTQAVTLLRQLNDRAGLVDNLANRAITYSEDKNYQPSIRDFSEAVDLADSLGDSYRLAAVLNNFAHTYVDAALATPGELADKRALYLREAKKTLQQALNINQQNRNLDALADNYKYIALLDSVNGNYKEALAAFEQYKFYYDSMFSANSQKTIQKLEDQRQIDVRDKQIEINNLDLHNQRNQRWFFIIGLFVLFLIGALLFFQSRQRKKANGTLRSLNAQLDKANRAKAKLFGIIGHDLRGPVANLINFLHLRNEAPDLSEEGLERHEQKIAAGARNLLNTMEDLLLWGKGQMNNFSPQKNSLAVHDLFAEMRLLYPDGDRLQIRFVDEEQLELFTDGDYLKTILRNLTTNAIKAIREQPQGVIVWRAWQKDGHSYLSITDNGQGLPEAGQHVLFGETVVNGTNGFGLHLIRDFAAAIDVTIDVQTPPGGGTIFLLSL